MSDKRKTFKLFIDKKNYFVVEVSESKEEMYRRFKEYNRKHLHKKIDKSELNFAAITMTWKILVFDEKKTTTRPCIGMLLFSEPQLASHEGLETVVHELLHATFWYHHAHLKAIDASRNGNGSMEAEEKFCYDHGGMVHQFLTVFKDRGIAIGMPYDAHS